MDRPRKRPERFNDGKLQFGKITTTRQLGKKVGETFTPTYSLYFNLMEIRQQDYDLQGASDQTIDLKLKTPFVKDVSKDSHKVLIDEILYDIYMIDKDLDETKLYWYLTKVGRYNGQGNA